jgi:hypothetical protein
MSLTIVACCRNMQLWCRGAIWASTHGTWLEIFTLSIYVVNICCATLYNTGAWWPLHRSSPLCLLPASSQLRGNRESDDHLPQIRKYNVAIHPCNVTRNCTSSARYSPQHPVMPDLLTVPCGKGAPVSQSFCIYSVVDGRMKVSLQQWSDILRLRHLPVRPAT